MYKYSLLLAEDTLNANICSSPVTAMELWIKYNRNAYSRAFYLTTQYNFASIWQPLK